MRNGGRTSPARVGATQSIVAVLKPRVRAVLWWLFTRALGLRSRPFPRLDVRPEPGPPAWPPDPFSRVRHPRSPIPRDRVTSIALDEPDEPDLSPAVAVGHARSTDGDAAWRVNGRF